MEVPMKRVMVVAGLLLGALSVAPACAGELQVVANTPREAVIALPGGTARLALAKAWGRTSEPRPDGKAWKAEGEQLPAVIVAAGEEWIEFSIPLKLEKDDRIRIYQFDLTLPETTGWQDADGTHTCIRRGPQWQSVAELLARQKAPLTNWAWPVVPGLTSLYEKSTTRYGMSAQDIWTGFGGDFFRTVPDPLHTVDVSAIVRTNGSGRVLALVAEQAMAVAWETNRVSICPVLRNARSAQEKPVRVRLYCGRGDVSPLAAKWVAEMDRTPLRVVFCGDSVGAENVYTAQIAGRLFQEFGDKVRTLNTSRGGATTREFLDVWQGRVMDYNPNLVVVQLCYNDVGRIKPEDVAANLRKMIDAVLAVPGGRAVVLTPLSYDKKRVDDTLAKGTDINKVHTEQYIPALQKVVADYEAEPKTRGKVAFADIWHALAKVRAEKGADHVLLPDGSHPNAEGHKVIADTAWPEVKRLAESSLRELKELP
jgi:lysophospholipase L1-like esterase